MLHAKIAVYPGSFDPITVGHVDIIKRASLLFDQVIVAVTMNPAKICTFTVFERVGMIKKVLPHSQNLRVESFSGLLVDYLQKKKAQVIIRGLRAVSDFEYEFQMALMNRHLRRGIETVFLTPDERYTYLSSNLIKEIGCLGGDIRSFVPPQIYRDVLDRLNSLQK